MDGRGNRTIGIIYLFIYLSYSVFIEAVNYSAMQTYSRGVNVA